MNSSRRHPDSAARVAPRFRPRSGGPSGSSGPPVSSVSPGASGETGPSGRGPSGRSPSGGSGDAGPGFALIGPDGHVRTLAELEEEAIRLALRHYGGNLSEVARRLGIGRSTLYRRLEKD